MPRKTDQRGDPTPGCRRQPRVEFGVRPPPHDAAEVLDACLGGGDRRTVLTQGLTVGLLTSLPPEQADPARLLALWRGHWQIENGLHWVPHVTLGEDPCQVPPGPPPPPFPPRPT